MADRITRSEVIPRRRTERDTEAQWYWVAATYKAVHLRAERKRHLWERTVFFARATNDNHARALANEVAREKEIECDTATHRVRWVFQQIEDVQCLHDSEFENGTEVYWEFFERVDKRE